VDPLDLGMGEFKTYRQQRKYSFQDLHEAHDAPHFNSATPYFGKVDPKLNHLDALLMNRKQEDMLFDMTLSFKEVPLSKSRSMMPYPYQY
jgi:hypothetical protein